MVRQEIIQRIIASRSALVPERGARLPLKKGEAEGGCGVIGIACSEKIAGHHLLQALKQMRNRGNNKGGGMAAVGLIPEELGVSKEVLEGDYLLSVAYLDSSVRSEVERTRIEPIFQVDHVRHAPSVRDFKSIKGIEVQPPDVYQYFVQPKADVVEEFQKSNGLKGKVSKQSVMDEIVYQNSYGLNRAFYASTGEKRAFVLSHGKNIMVLKMVGYGDDLIHYYQLEDLHAHVWIGHHRYPTKGKVWHPGGAHPFVGLHEALVHNGDFANYASMCSYLAQRNIYPLFLTDTEVSAQLFDLLHRTYGYPLEYVIEALAPTTERDFALLPKDKQEVYRMLQTVHVHGSPDGPWFFLVAQSAQPEGTYRLIGITDTSMLRPQVFAFQQGSASIGFAASEKQAIDATLASLAAEDNRFWTRADLFWNARGGSHADGGAFIFTVDPNGHTTNGHATMTCTDKFGRQTVIDLARQPYVYTEQPPRDITLRQSNIALDSSAEELFGNFVEGVSLWDYDDVKVFLSELESVSREAQDYRRAIDVLTLLTDRKYPTGNLRRSNLLSLLDKSFSVVVESIRQFPSDKYVVHSSGMSLPDPRNGSQTVVIDARGLAPEGKQSLALQLVQLYKQGWRKFLLVYVQGHRFIGNGLGPATSDVRIDVYGSSGDYLASGIDGAQVFVHGNAQDQLAQIMKDGTLVVHGDVGQTFMYAAKGGKVFVLGNAAGRPLINAVGKPRVVINGTCLDYLAESFMAGDPLNGGGFVILNGITWDDEARIVDLPEPYPGGNLFSLASGGAIYIRDPHRRVSEEQLNGGEFVTLTSDDWALIELYLKENERLFGIPVAQLLQVDGDSLPGERVYRKIRPGAMRALQAEEAWVKKV